MASPSAEHVEDLPSLFPNVNFFLHRPVLSEPPLCTLKELEDGTYSLMDVLLMNELLDLKKHLKEANTGDDDDG